MKICVAGPIATQDVLHLLHTVPAISPVGYGGAPLTAVLMEQLLALGHEVVGITVDYTLPARSAPIVLCGARFTFVVLPGRRRAWRFNGARLGRVLDLFRHERQAIAQAVAGANCDVVHAHWTYEFALGALDSGTPHVITAHDCPEQVLKYTRSPYRALRWLMAREALAKARSVTTVSDYMASRVQAKARAPVAVVPNPVAGHVLARGHVRVAPHGLSVGMVCNGWSAHKNPEPALHAFARLRQRLPAAELHVFGSDFGPGQCAQTWARVRHCADGVTFHGAVPHRQLIASLAGMDLLLHPALEESFGVVIAEALALGLPVVAGADSGAVAWVAGPGQWLCDVKSVDAIYAALCAALEDAAAYGFASQAGLQRVRVAYSPQAVVEAYMEIYFAAIADQTRGRSPN